MKKSSDEYLARVDELVGARGQVYEMTDSGDVAPIYVAVYDDVPEVGHLTAFTFGLSSARRKEWVGGRPELMISVRSIDHAWGLCVGEIVRRQRDSSLFEYGTILHFREQIVGGCSLTSFLVFVNSLLDGGQSSIELSDRRINIAQVYPIYESEAAVIQDMGVERFFWDLGLEFSDLSRRPAQI